MINLAQRLNEVAAEQGVKLLLVTAGEESARVPAADELVMVELGHVTLREACAASGVDAENAVGFQRYTPDGLTWTGLVELVAGAAVTADRLAQATELVEASGLSAVASADQPGRIVDRLFRPYFNRALRAVEAGIAAPDDIDHAIEMGLAYRQGPMKWLAGSATEHHHEVSAYLHDLLGEAAYHPAPASKIAMRVARARKRP